MSLSVPPSRSDLRHFGSLVGGILLAVGSWWIFREKSGVQWAFARAFLFLGAPLIILAGLSPSLLK